ncbi:hypothetical protein [Gilliamella apicola]|uniref:hypothetical protein n=1 Tax=Gilliamella apicola TaxID=1196095 RepID=UPI00080ECD1F|nr:hypothetical protein [Gilliamella apicola]OCG10503.1 hypothetical protein A9G14_10420 [Gilliamella apicola]ORF45195.1 hypothetical protein B5800_08705 [Gilliamella apicola]ORF48732.1 hypothetical protein B5799_07455 [Gilliamella apicola]ORF51193.1 hypothetical protein B5803_07690 [Gilliamella apicola]ORF53398.1 hypothetical protein B5798_09480 [Gilliamella apicola]
MKFKFTALVFMLTFVQTTLANTAEVAVQHFPNPSTVSQSLQPLVSGATPFWNDHPKINAEWHQWVDTIAAQTLKTLPTLKERMQVSVTATQLGNVNAFMVTPKTIAPYNQNRILLHYNSHSRRYHHDK